MDTQKTPITCPRCARTTTLRVPLKVNTLRDRGAREGVLSGSLFAFACAGCSFSAEVLPRGFLYQDPDRRLMVYLSPQGEPVLSSIQLPASFSDYRLRVVSDRVRLVEQILIAEARLDDRQVLLFEALMKPTVDRGQVAAPEWTVFAGLLGDGAEVALSLPDGSVVALDRRHLDAVASSCALPDDPPLQWRRIDAAWARAWLEAHPVTRSGSWWHLE